MKQVVHSFFLACFFVPFSLFAVIFPDPSIAILEFCQEERKILDAYSCQIDGLASLIEQYEENMAKQRESALIMLQRMASYQLPERSLILEWQNFSSPYLNDPKVYQAKFHCAYEWGKLLTIQEELSSFSYRRSHFWRNIDQIERLTEGLRFQLQIVRIQQETLLSHLNQLAETTYDSLIQQEIYGNSWIGMKTDMKLIYQLLDDIRSLGSKNLHQIQEDFVDLKHTVAQHLLPQSETDHWPPLQSSHYYSFYQLVCFDIIPGIHHILMTYEAKHQAFFHHQFEAKLYRLSHDFAQTQIHLRQMAKLHQQPIVSSGSEIYDSTSGKTPQ